MVKAFSSPPTELTTFENSPSGWAFVPLNIRCSRKWAMPDSPGRSSAAPALYQTMWVTIGARWSGMTTTSSPLSRVKLVAFFANFGASAAATDIIRGTARTKAKARAVDVMRRCSSLAAPGDGAVRRRI